MDDEDDGRNDETREVIRSQLSLVDLEIVIGIGISTILCLAYLLLGPNKRKGNAVVMSYRTTVPYIL